ncbi:hypothetical protein ACF0H5_015827 [Mactra antiquata]
MHLKRLVLMIVFTIGAIQYASSSPAVAPEESNAEESLEKILERQKRNAILQAQEQQTPAADINEENEEIGDDAEFERLRRYLEDEIDELDNDEEEDEDDNDGIEKRSIDYDDEDDDEEDEDDDGGFKKRSLGDYDDEDDDDDDDDDDDGLFGKRSLGDDYIDSVHNNVNVEYDDLPFRS